MATTRLLEWNDPAPVKPGRDPGSVSRSVENPLVWDEPLAGSADPESEHTSDPTDSPPDPSDPAANDQTDPYAGGLPRLQHGWQDPSPVRPSRRRGGGAPTPATEDSDPVDEPSESDPELLLDQAVIHVFASDLAAIEGRWMNLVSPEEMPARSETWAVSPGPPIYVLLWSLALAGWLGIWAQIKWSVMGYQAFDYGIFNQGLWLMSEGRTPFVTLRGLNLFGDHSSYIMVLLIPVKWLIVDPRLLLWIAVLAVASCGPLAYWAARISGASQRRSMVAAAIVGIHPALLWHVTNAFHPETLAVPIAILGYIAVVRGKWWHWASCMWLIALVKEDSLLLTVPFAAFVWIKWREGRKSAVWVAASTTVLSMVNILLVIPWLQSGRAGYQYARRFTPSTLLELDRWKFPILIVGIALILGKKAWPALLIGLPSLLLHMTSHHSPEWDMTFQYTAYGLAAASVAVVFAARDARRLQLQAALLVMIGFTLIAGPWSGIHDYDPWAGTIVDSRETHRILDSIPPDAGLSINHSFGGVFSQRDVVYAYPAPWERFNWGVPGSPEPDPTLVDLIVVVDYDDIRWQLEADPAWQLIDAGGQLAVFAPAAFQGE